MRKLSITLLLLLTLCTNSHAQVISGDVSGLSLEECILLALTNHPSLTKAHNATRSIAAQLETLRAAMRVKADVSGSLRYNGDYDNWDSRNLSETLSITATKLLYDTGRNKLQQQIRLESLMGSEETARSTQVTVAANAKRAYYDLVLKLLNRDVEREKLTSLEAHLKTAQGLYEVGNSPFIEVTKAQSDVASARVSLLKAENDILVSQEALRVAIGTDIHGPFDVILSTELLTSR